MASSFMLKAWNGEQVPIPGVNQVVEAIRGETTETTNEEENEEVETADTTVAEEEEVEEVKPDLSMSRLRIERNLEQIQAFENKEGYLRAGSEAEYEELVTALSRFSVEGGAQPALDAARGSREFPLFFSVALGEKVEEKPLHQVVGTATVESCKDREEAYPLIEGEVLFVIGKNPFAGESSISVSRYKNMRDFIEGELSAIAGSKKKGLWEAAHAGLRDDMRYFGVKAVPGIFTAKIWWMYEGKTEKHIQGVRFLPYRESRTLSTHSKYQEVRREFAEAMDFDPNRLEKEIEKVVEKANARRVFVSYQPHDDNLAAVMPSATTDVRIIPMTPDDLWKEADRVGAALLGAKASIAELEIKILDDLGLYTVVNGKKIYHHDQFPDEFARIDRESKSGAEGKMVSYRFTQELIPVKITSRAKLQAVIQQVLDLDPKQVYFEYGCVQSRDEILGLFNQYQSSFAKPADALPCYMGYDYAVRQVVMFQKVEEVPEAKTAPSDPDSDDEKVQPTNVYGLSSISKQSFKNLKNLITEDHGVTVTETMHPLAAYKRGIERSIKEGKTTVTLQGSKVIGGYLKFTVLDSKVDAGIVEK